MLFCGLLTTFALAGSSNVGYYMQPSIRGDQLVFVSQGDLWRVSSQGGEAHALTSHVAPASNPRISPDGKTIAYSGTYDGPREAYVMSLSGELPKRITYHDRAAVVGWTPSGKVMVATSAHSTLPNVQMETVNPNTGETHIEPLYQAADGCYGPDGKTLYFTRFSFQGSNTKRYKGGTAQSIWKYTEGDPEAKPLTASFTGTSKNPMIWEHRIYFLSDRDGIMNLWSMNLDGGELKQLTHSTSWDIQSASNDQGVIAYQLGADIHVLNLTTQNDKKLDITLASDFDQSRERLVKNPMAYATAVHPSFDGSKIAVTARGQVFVAPAEPGRFVTASKKSSVRYRDAIFSTDGKSVYALADETGETEWWKLPANGVGQAEQMTHGAKVLNRGGTLSPDGKFIAYGNLSSEFWLYDIAGNKSTRIVASQDGGIGDVAWSPDSQWLAYVQPTVSFDRIMLYSVKTGVSTAVTTSRSDSESPAWSPDGKWLYFLSNRTFNTSVGSPWGPRQPEPYFDRQTRVYQLGLTKGQISPFHPSDELSKPSTEKPKTPVTVDVDLDHIQDRLWVVPTASGNYDSLHVAGDHLYFVNHQPGANSLDAVDIKNTDVTVRTVMPGIDGYDLSGDGKKLEVVRGGQIYMTDAANSSLQKAVDFSGWTFLVDPKQEWVQMFIESWRLERDYFYDPKLHSVDWNGVLAKYRPLADRVRDREELSDLIAQMVGELTALHTFVYGGDSRSSTESIPEASLGASLNRLPAAGGYVVEKIYRGDPDYPDQVAPLARPGTDVHEGDTITQVNGNDVLGVADISELLRNQAGHQVLLHVKTKEGVVRDAIVVPLPGYAEGGLRYSDWEISRRDKTDQLSSNQIGYVHLRAMGSGDMDQWERDFYPVFDRQGLIIDVRHNNGGNIDSWIIEKLLRKAWFYWQPRVGNPNWNMQWAFRGHIAVLCDENTASDGEAFTEGIKRLGIGKVFGTRTWGGEIWLSSDNVLVDGGIATAAETGVFGPDGRWLIENHGVDPDVIVDNLPHATFLGKDAQLEAAIAYLQKQIKEHPMPVPVHPNYPDKSFRPKGSK